jgi:hypothetical protein
MNSDLDDALGQLAASMGYPDLGIIDDAVMSRIHARSAHRSGLGIAAAAAVGAIALGTMAAVPAPATAEAAPLAPFSADNPLAPSTLLLDGQ